MLHIVVIVGNAVWPVVQSGPLKAELLEGERVARAAQSGRRHTVFWVAVVKA